MVTLPFPAQNIFVKILWKYMTVHYSGPPDTCLKKKKKVFQQFNLKRAFCNFNPMQMADYYDANQLSLRITATWKRSLSYTMVFLLCSRAGGERNGASVIVIPEVTPRNSPEGTEWRLGDRISRLATSMGFCSQLN